MNAELNIINNKLTKNESQACIDIMCTDILTGKMIDGYSMLHGLSMATSKKSVYKGPHQLAYVLEALYVSITSHSHTSVRKGKIVYGSPFTIYLSSISYGLYQHGQVLLK